VIDQLCLLPGLLAAHVRLTLSALFVGTLLSVPAGILAAKIRGLDTPLTAAAAVVQTVPSLALLAVMVPLLAALGLPNIGTLPAFLGLVVYSVLPILQNTVAGIKGVEPAYLEASRGIGMTAGQQLRRVEIPLALPVMVAGLRTATVWTVGIATLSTPVGAPSLGNFIFTGLQTRNLDSVLVGCVAAALLALVLDAVVRGIAHGLERRRPLLWSGAVAILFAVGGAALFESVRPAAAESPIVVGSKAFTEQYILSEIVAGVIEDATNQSPERKQSLGSSVAFDALRTGAIDLYVDYSGTVWATILERDTSATDREAVLREVERELARRYGIELVASLGFENAYALAMRREDARSRGIGSISELAAQAPELTMGGDYEFFGRAEWRALVEVYGLRFRDQRTMDPALMYEAVATDAVDVISAFSTDGRIAADDLVLLEDDRHAIPPYDAVLLAGAELRNRHPAVVEALERLEGQIGGEAMRAMNASVDQAGESPRRVARDFLLRLPELPE
jgi:osmoprotectant transport system permease protein